MGLPVTLLGQALRALALTCAPVVFGRDQICMQVDVTFSPFGHRFCCSLLANKIQDISDPMVTFWPCGTKPLASFKWLFLRPACTCKFSVRLLATTCVSIWTGLQMKNGGNVSLCSSPWGPTLLLILSSLLSSDVFNTHVNNFLSSRNEWTTRSVKVKEKSKEAALEALVDLAEGALRWVSSFL